MTTMQKIKEIEDEVRWKRGRERERPANRRARSPSSDTSLLSSSSPPLQMARTQKNKATAGHLGMLKVKREWEGGEACECARPLHVLPLSLNLAPEPHHHLFSSPVHYHLPGQARQAAAGAAGAVRHRLRRRWPGRRLRRHQGRRRPGGAGRLSVSGQIHAADQTDGDLLRGGRLRVHDADLRPGRHPVPGRQDPAAGPAGHHRGRQGRERARATGHRDGPHLQPHHHRPGRAQTADAQAPDRA